MYYIVGNKILAQNIQRPKIDRRGEIHTSEIMFIQQSIYNIG